MRILTNMDGLAEPAAGVDEVHCFTARAGVRLSFLRDGLRSFRYHVVVVNCSPTDVLLFAAWKAIMPWWPCRLIAVDTVLPVPPTETPLQRFRLAVKRFLFRRVDYFIEYFDDSSGYERHYGIARSRWVFVPFKVNDYENVLATATADHGYIFCTGRTRRDFHTLIRASSRAGCPLKIVTMHDTELGEHDSRLDDAELPSNVEVVRQTEHDPFLGVMAKARVVVVPIKARNISASGISVSLTAMALGKCVIMTDGPAVKGFLDDGQVVVVPPENERSLAQALRAMWDHPEARKAFEVRARAFARRLQGGERLYRDIHRIVSHTHRHGHPNGAQIEGLGARLAGSSGVHDQCP